MCCGNRRTAWQTPPGPPLPDLGGPRRPPPAAAGTPPARRLRTNAEFQYMGATALTVEGPVTGRRYRFGAPGAVVAVDLLDRRALAAVPQLREV